MSVDISFEELYRLVDKNDVGLKWHKEKLGIFNNFRSKITSHYKEKYSSVNWFFGRKITLFSTLGVDEKTVYAVEKGISDLIKEMGFKFQIIRYNKGPADALQMQIEHYAKISCSADGRLNTDALSKNLGNVHASLAKESFYSGIVVITPYGSQTTPGRSEFETGTMIFGKYDYANPDLMRLLAMHEAFHLFGLNYSDHRQIRTLWLEKFRFDYNGDCLANHSASSNVLCLPCRLALRFFWEGVRESAKFDIWR